MKKLLSLLAIIALSFNLKSSVFADTLFPNSPSTGQAYSLNGKLWQYDGTAWNMLGRGGFVSFIGAQVLTSGSSATFSPGPGASFWKVTCTGGGGGGGGSDAGNATDTASAGGGGEAGGTTISYFDQSEMGANATYTIGTGGTAGSNSGGAGGDGNDTTFDPAGTGSTATAAGGDGGDGPGQPATTITDHGIGGEAEGTATNGDINIAGGSGDGGHASGDVADDDMGGATGGTGGGSFWGGGGRGGIVSNGGAGDSAGQNGQAYGAGGGGAASARSTTGAAGGTGKDGICVVEEYGNTSTSYVGPTTLIASGSISGVATTDFDASSYYDKYKVIDVILTDVTSGYGASEDYLMMRINDGSSWITGASYELRYQYWSGTTYTTAVSSVQTSINPLCYFIPNYGTYAGVNIRFYNMNSPYTSIYTEGIGFDSAGVNYPAYTWSWAPASTSMKRFRILTASGTNMSFSYKIIGYN